MRRILAVLALIGLAGPLPVRADGLLVPTDRSLPPLSLTYQRVNVAIESQVATTSVEQVYRNSTQRDLEADYLFPLPAGATVREFAMWVGGKRLTGETIDALKARKTYEDIVRRLQDPGLLEYVDRDLWKVRIFPVPRLGEQKIEIKFTTLLARDGDLVSYQYPLRTGQTPRQVTGDFTMVVNLKSPDPLGPVYSPTHDVAVNRKGDREAVVSFERSRYTLDRDFNLYFAPKSKAVGLSLLTQRESQDKSGYFLLLLSPGAQSDEPTVPRDLVVVLDTSHSMTGEKIEQAKGALRAALDSLKPDDRFALIQFATVVTPFRETLLKANEEHLAEARAWVKKLEAQGATDIGSALEEALKLRPKDGDGRSFQVVFFTDGLPTAGSNSSEILKLLKGRDIAGVRIFTFGVGDDVDAHLLDQLAEASRATSTYVRPSENLEAKASTLVAKISHPVRTELKLRAGEGIRLVEMYPPHLPDLFRGEQLQVAGRYEGSGHVTLTLESRVGERRLTDTYEANIPERSSEHDFIAPIWARRKVGYLLDQIRLHGESSEVKSEVIRLAREFGIATPYTSFLIVPDSRPGLAMPVQPGAPGAMSAMGDGYHLSVRGPQLQGSRGSSGGYAFQPGSPPGQQQSGAQAPSDKPGQNAGNVLSRARGAVSSPPAQREALQKVDTGAKAPSSPAAFAVGGGGLGSTAVAYDFARVPASGRDAIDLAQRLAELKRTEGRGEADQPVKSAGGQKFRLIEDVWVDDRYQAKAPTLKIKAFGATYFRLLEQHPELKGIFALGQRVVWISPNGTALVIDRDGEDEVAAATLDKLFSR
jgi:Ca-activated chloride channel family protein